VQVRKLTLATCGFLNTMSTIEQIIRRNGVDETFACPCGSFGTISLTQLKEHCSRHDGDHAENIESITATGITGDWLVVRDDIGTFAF
jgi:hypothetical protein